MSWSEAQIVLTEPLEGSLLIEQHPDFARLPLSLVDAGFDNELWRLGNKRLVRLSRRHVAAELIANEQRWLPELAPHWSLPTPIPLRLGSPSARYPWPWSIVSWLDGTPGNTPQWCDPMSRRHHWAPF